MGDRPPLLDAVALGVVGYIDRVYTAMTLADAVRADYVSIDDGTRGCTGNHLNVWAHLNARSSDTDWTVVLEDDALPVTDFGPQLQAMLDAAPTPVVSLYLGTGRPPAWQNWSRQMTRRADAQDACFIPGTHLLHAVGVAIRSHLVGDMLAAVQELPPTVDIDDAIGRWAAHQRVDISYCWPSLVDHADLPTVAQHSDRQPRTDPRHAWSVGRRTRWAPTLVVTGRRQRHGNHR